MELIHSLFSVVSSIGISEVSNHCNAVIRAAENGLSQTSVELVSVVYEQWCKMYRCHKCATSFQRKYNLVSHLKLCGQTKKKKILCPFYPECKTVKNCSGLYANKGNLKIHFNRHHQNEKIEFEQLKIVEVECGVLLDDAETNNSEEIGRKFKFPMTTYFSCNFKKTFEYIIIVCTYFRSNLGK